MAKERTAYVCSECGHEASKWLGRCPSCGLWNTFKQISLGKPVQVAPIRSKWSAPSQEPAVPNLLSNVKAEETPRTTTGDGELDRVLGGGLVPGSLILLGGEPGIGKSTLLLQTVLRLPGGKRVLYVSGEESEQQIKMRADRVEPAPRTECYLLCETNLDKICSYADELRPDLLVIDSIQTMAAEVAESLAGSVSQIRACAACLLQFAKGSGIPIVLVGHITKEGSIAGPKVLEHIVDCVLQFEGDRHYLYRILRAQKNRFGSTSELGIYEMRFEGLRAVDNPSGLLLADDRAGFSGVTVAATVEGVRPFLVEVQALVSSAVYGVPQRSCTGFDMRRLNMLLAVLEKRVGFKLGAKDVCLNIAGGLRVTDPATDLAVVAAVLSSNVDTPVEADVALCGEVGLSGEVRPIARIEQRIAEAEKMGFTSLVLPETNMHALSRPSSEIRLVPARRIEDALRELFG